MLVGVEWHVLSPFWLTEACRWIPPKENSVWKSFSFLPCISAFALWISSEHISRDTIWSSRPHATGILPVTTEVTEGSSGLKLSLLISEIAKFDTDFVVLATCDEVLRWWSVAGEKSLLFVPHTAWISDDTSLWDKQLGEFLPSFLTGASLSVGCNGVCMGNDSSFPGSELGAKIMSPELGEEVVDAEFALIVTLASAQLSRPGSGNTAMLSDLKLTNKPRTRVTLWSPSSDISPLSFKGESQQHGPLDNDGSTRLSGFSSSLLIVISALLAADCRRSSSLSDDALLGPCSGFSSEDHAVSKERDLAGLAVVSLVA